MPENQVTEVEAEVITIETTINHELAKANITDTIINGLKEKYGQLKIAGMDDKEGYNAVKDARKECKSWRVMAQKICKKGREEAVAIQKAWVAKEKEVSDRIAEVEDYLEVQEKEYEAEKERVKAEQKAKEEARYTSRTMQLSQCGATFNGIAFVLDDVSFGVDLIRESTDEVFEGTILPKYREIFEKKETIRRQEKEEKERMERELELERQRLEEERENLRKQQAEIEAKKREEEEKRLAEERQKIEAKIRERSLQLAEIGMKSDGTNFVFDDVILLQTQIREMSEEEWALRLEQVKPVVEAKKKENEEREKAYLEEQKRIAAEEAARKEREKIEAEQRKKEEERLAEEQRKAEELEKASDKEKWAFFIQQIEELKFPSVSSKYFRGKLKSAQDKIDEILAL